MSLWFRGEISITSTCYGLTTFGLARPVSRESSRDEAVRADHDRPPGPCQSPRDDPLRRGLSDPRSGPEDPLSRGNRVRGFARRAESRPDPGDPGAVEDVL